MYFFSGQSFKTVGNENAETQTQTQTCIKHFSGWMEKMDASSSTFFHIKEKE